MRRGGLAMKHLAQAQPAKRPVNLLLNEATVQQARVYTQNLSSTVDALLAEFVARERQLRQDQQQPYAQVAGAWNRFEEAHGSFADEHSTLGASLTCIAISGARRRRCLMSWLCSRRHSMRAGGGWSCRWWPAICSRARLICRVRRSIHPSRSRGGGLCSTRSILFRYRWMHSGQRSVRWWMRAIAWWRRSTKCFRGPGDSGDERFVFSKFGRISG